MSDIEIGDLEELTGGKGWQWLMAQAEKEFGAAALVDKLRAIASNAQESAELRQAKTEQAFVSQRALLGFLAMPQAEIDRQRAVLRTRPDEFAEQRKRGSTL